MTVTVYRSTDAGAPQLNGVAGSLITVLDAVLVNGYGSKPAAGWTKPFSGTNKAVYRNSPTLGTGTYYRVRDDATNGINATCAQVRGYETMTNVDTGAGPFPSFTQRAESTPSICIIKSVVQSSATRTWLIVADERCAYIFVNIFGVSPAIVGGLTNIIGDIKSYMPTDNTCAVLCGNNISGGSYSSNFPYSSSSSDMFKAAAQAPVSMSKIRRGHIGNVSEPYDVTVIGQGMTSAGGFGSGGFAYPSQVSNSLNYTRAICNAAGVPRGEFLGLLQPTHDRPFPPGDTVSIEGRDYLVVISSASSETVIYGQVLVDITGPW